RRPDAALHRTHRLAVGVAALEAGFDQGLPDVGQLVDACAEEVDPLAAGDLAIEVEPARDLAERDQLLGRISPPGTRGTTEYVPPRWMFARKWSWVSWMVGWFSTKSFHVEARIEATAGRQISHPSPLPWRARTSSKHSSRLILTIWKRSSRL